MSAKVIVGMFKPTLLTLRFPRSGHTSTVLRSGLVLITCGMDPAALEANQAELLNPDPEGTALAPPGPMTKGRADCSATLLPDGRVLVAGGSGDTSAELYDASTTFPPAGTFSATGNMTLARCGHTATLLANGKVLIAGGRDCSFGMPVSTATAELYDPARGTFTPTGSMVVRRIQHTATRLPDGRVLVTGGTDNGQEAVPSAELYDPQSGTFTLTFGAPLARYSHSATLLADGTVLLIGGYAGGLATVPVPRASTELYDPKTDLFSPSGDMATSCKCSARCFSARSS